MPKYTVFLIADLTEIDVLCKSFQHIKICSLNNELIIKNISKEHYFFPDQNAIVIHSGIGKVNAAITLTYLINILVSKKQKTNNFLQFISNWKIAAIINLGYVNGLNKWMKMGDVFEIEKAVYCDFDLTAFDYPFGYIPNLGGHWKLNTFLNKYPKATCLSADFFCDKNSKLQYEFEENKNYLFDMEIGGYAQTLERLIHPTIFFYSFKVVSDLMHDPLSTADQYKNEHNKRSASFSRTFEDIAKAFSN